MAINDQRTSVLNKLYEHYGRQYWWESENQLADWLSMILIQQTTEANAKRALESLEPHLEVEILHNMELEELQSLIYSAGFYKQKSTYIKALMSWYVGHGASIDKFNAIPTDELRKELLSIKGVGFETADAMLLYIFKRNVFIADVYARRLFARLDIGDYPNYESMRKDFMPLVENISNELCREWHAVIDVHGKAFGANKLLDESWLKE